MMRLCFVLVDRANLRLLPVMCACAERFDVHVLCGGTMPLSRFGNVSSLLDHDFVVTEVWHESDGCEPINMALGCGNGIAQYAHEYRRLKPDLMICIGDRYELLGAVVAAHLMNVPILHFQGGEVSGCVDNRTRNAITQMATWHVPATKGSAYNVGRMVGQDGIITTGCPSSDLAAEIDLDDEADGPLMVMFHPDTTGDGSERKQMDEVLAAVSSVPHRVECWWPNSDAHNDQIHQAIRHFREKPRDWFSVVRNLEPHEFMQRLANTRCCVGNSSSFVRDAGFFGTPVVLIGDRQRGREHDENVLHVPPERKAIVAAMEQQLAHGRYDLSGLYGDGCVAERVVEWLERKQAELDALQYAGMGAS